MKGTSTAGKFCEGGEISKPEKGIISPGAGVTGNCEPLSMRAENQTQVLQKSGMCS